jgi:hypothetical protein
MAFRMREHLIEQSAHARLEDSNIGAFRSSIGNQRIDILVPDRDILECFLHPHCSVTKDDLQVAKIGEVFEDEVASACFVQLWRIGQAQVRQILIWRYKTDEIGGGNWALCCSSTVPWLWRFLT